MTSPKSKWYRHKVSDIATIIFACSDGKSRCWCDIAWLRTGRFGVVLRRLAPCRPALLQAATHKRAVCYADTFRGLLKLLLYGSRQPQGSGLAKSGFESQQTQAIPLFSQTSTPALGPTQAPLKRVPVVLPTGKVAGTWRWPLISMERPV